MSDSSLSNTDQEQMEKMRGSAGSGLGKDAESCSFDQSLPKLPIVDSAIKMDQDSPSRKGIGAAFSSMTADDFGGPQNGGMSPHNALEESFKCYEKFKSLPLIIEGPEFTKDYSYFL